MKQSLFLLLGSGAGLLHNNRLLTAQDSTSPPHCTHLEVLPVASLEERLTDGLQGLARIALQLNTRVVLGRLSQTRPVASDQHDALARGGWLHPHSFSLHQTVVAERVTTLQVVRLL